MTADSAAASLGCSLSYALPALSVSPATPELRSSRAGCFVRRGLRIVSASLGVIYRSYPSYLLSPDALQDPMTPTDEYGIRISHKQAVPTFLRLSVIRCRSSSACLACNAGAAVVSRRIWRFLRSCSTRHTCQQYERTSRDSTHSHQLVGSSSISPTSSDVLIC